MLVFLYILLYLLFIALIVYTLVNLNIFSL